MSRMRHSFGAPLTWRCDLRVPRSPHTRRGRWPRGAQRLRKRLPGMSRTSSFVRAAGVLGAALWLLATAAAQADTDPSFVLRAGLGDVPRYFPGYLGNGYIATLTAPRGTEATRSYLVAFMDYTGGDMSRPAAVPGWTEIDFSASAPGEPQAWLNRAAVIERHFRDYEQTLDLRAATLTTRYRYVDRSRETAVEVTTLVSEASPHLEIG